MTNEILKGVQNGKLKFEVKQKQSEETESHTSISLLCHISLWTKHQILPVTAK
jgi:hypothetical protein